MKIAIMGIRGLPAKYGGFETFAEELAPRLVKKSHKVTVYGRSNIIKEYRTGDYYRGVRLVILPTVSHKYLDTIVHTFFCVIHSLFHQYDVILFCNAANSIFSFLPRLSGQKVVINVDGLERKRKKWNFLGKLWYLAGEFFSTILPNEIVSDAKVIQNYYWNRYHKKSTFIPYGANIDKVNSTEVLDKFGVRSKEYILYVSRLEPENNAHIVIDAFKRINTSKKLVIVGDAPYATEYKSYLKDLAKNDCCIVFTGFVFGNGYKELQSNAYCYVHAGEVGGTPPALVEAMGFGNCVIVNGTSENMEVVGNAGIIYKKNNVDDLADKLQDIIDHREKREIYQERAGKHVEKCYSWKMVVNEYEKLFKSLIKDKDLVSS